MGSMAAGAVTGAIFKSTGMFSWFSDGNPVIFSSLFRICQLALNRPLLLLQWCQAWQESGVM